MTDIHKSLHQVIAGLAVGTPESKAQSEEAARVAIRAKSAEIMASLQNQDPVDKKED